jgi:Fic family protein
VKPPFQLTAEVLGLCGRVERLLGRCEGLGGSAPSPQLRRENRVRTIHATTAIEGNTLSLAQVTDVLEGKHVRGSAHELLEIKNAIAAYDAVSKLDPLLEKDLLRAHGVLMSGLATDAGRYRRGNVGALAGDRVAHVAPKADRVPALMADLFAFVADETTPPLVQACVFHYELEFIHPFSDGNGRVGRLWQHVLLRRHSAVFEHLPAESTIKEHQREYYEALARSDRDGDATPFVVFMLQRLERGLSQMAAMLGPAREDFRGRLDRAATHFGPRSFSRKDYLALHASISAPTASRDLRAGVQRRLIRKRGDKATATYTFAPPKASRGRAKP